MAPSAIDHLRLLLDHLSETDRAQQLEFFRVILASGSACVPELNLRLPGARAPRVLRQLSLEASFYFPWPEWVPILSRILRYEADFAIFETGTRALGRVGTPEALDALRDLIAIRQGAEHKEVIAGVLSETDPAEAFNHHLSRLLLGSTNPGMANEAAQRLTRLVDGDCLDPLKAVVMHPDLLVFRHAILLIANIFTVEAAQALLELFKDNHAEVLADRSLKEALGAMRSLSGSAAREMAQERLNDLGQDSPGPLRSFFLQVITAADDNKQATLQAVFTQTAENMHLRARRLGFAVDATAEGLVGMVARGLMERDLLLERLMESYRVQTGREGVARSIARLVSAEDMGVLKALLAGPDGAQRAAAVEILGERQEEALRDALLMACRDSLTDIADRALFHLGRLQCAETLARELLHASAPEDLRLGLRLVGAHRYQELVPDLLEMIKNASREELALQAIEALGAVGAEKAAQPLLEMLHSGQSPKMQSALTQALRDVKLPEVALALCVKVDELRNAGLHLMAVEALAVAHGEAGPPLSEEGGVRLLGHVRQAWNDRNPWASRLRLVAALEGLQMANADVWRVLSDMVKDATTEKRPVGAWSPQELHRVQAAVREFAKRG